MTEDTHPAAIRTGQIVAPADGRAPRNLVYLLHGYGGNGDGMISLALALAPHMPGTLFVAPTAPMPFSQGAKWFAMDDIGQAGRMQNDRRLAEELQTTWLAGCRAAAPMVRAHIAAILAEHRIPPDRMAFVGMSQGAMLAFHVALGLDHSLACLVSIAGACLPDETLASGTIPPIPIFMMHGDADDVLPVSLLHESLETLKRLGLQAESYVAEGLDHGIDLEGLKRTGQFLIRHLS